MRLSASPDSSMVWWPDRPGRGADWGLNGWHQGMEDEGPPLLVLEVTQSCWLSLLPFRQSIEPPQRARATSKRHSDGLARGEGSGYGDRTQFCCQNLGAIFIGEIICICPDRAQINRLIGQESPLLMESGPCELFLAYTWQSLCQCVWFGNLTTWGTCTSFLHYVQS